MKAAIDADAALARSNGALSQEMKLDRLIMNTIKSNAQAPKAGCTIVQITAFEAPTRFYRLPLWSFIKSKKLQWVDIIMDPLVTAPSNQSSHQDSVYR